MTTAASADTAPQGRLVLVPPEKRHGLGGNAGSLAPVLPFRERACLSKQ